MAGYNMVRKIHELEKTLEDMGMAWGFEKYGGFGRESSDLVAVFPSTDGLPLYTRDAQLFCGTIDEVSTWLKGIAWAREYDRIMRVSDEKKRDRKEQDLRNHQLMQVLREQEKKQVDN